MTTKPLPGSIPVSDATIEAFASFFRGRTDAWGGVEGLCNKEQVTFEHYRRHLEGKTSLGVYMLLDDGKCWFAAADLDQKDQDKILAIKEGFAEVGVHAYPCYSKGKGFHLYVFADKEPFDAHEIRRLFVSVLTKLNIQCEIFPKQDKLDDKIPLGNYINLPLFGMNTRLFFTKAKIIVPADQVLPLFQRNSNETIAIARKTIPDPATIKQTAPQATKVKGRPKKIKTPACIDRLLKGVHAGERDVAAFALSRWYLEQNFLPEEVLPYLELWDSKNTPPIGNSNTLLAKIQSAAKGYGFGCASIVNEPLLSDCCPGEAQCVWLKEKTEERKKNGLIRELSFHVTDTHLFEQIYDGKEKTQFVSYELSTGATQIVDNIEYPSYTVVPVHGAELTESVIKFPTGIATPNGSLIELENQLISEVIQLVYDYVELPEQRDYWIVAHYVLLTWVYDKMNTISYLRFRGDTGVGKSRALTVIGGVCYKPLMMSGAVTPAPIYREIRRFRGTVILEEADFSDSSEKGEVVTILNCGMERGRAVLRCSPDDPNIIECLPVYGPKLFATRGAFQDKALEARCNTIIMKEAKRKVPTLINMAYENRAAELRKKLLLWRFLKLPLVDPEIEEIELGPVEQRLKQMALPLAIVFHERPGFIDELRASVKITQKNIRTDRAESDDAAVLQTLLTIALADGKEWVSSREIGVRMAAEGYFNKYVKDGDTSVATKRISVAVSTKIRNLGFSIQEQQRPHNGKRDRHIIWDQGLVNQLAIKYLPDAMDEFAELLTEKIDLDI